eukprot:5907753-Pyramimonas_sp.AAC.3
MCRHPPGAIEGLRLSHPDGGFTLGELAESTKEEHWAPDASHAGLLGDQGTLAGAFFGTGTPASSGERPSPSPARLLPACYPYDQIYADDRTAAVRAMATGTPSSRSFGANASTGGKTGAGDTPVIN